MDIREEEVEKFLDEHNDFTKSYFERKATSSMVDHWLANRSHRPGSRAMQVNHVRNDGKPERKSLGPSVLPSEKLKSLLSDDIDAMKSHSSRRKSELEVLDEKELFMELIRDIANELDINRLSHKILVNVSILTNADRCSLFLVQGSRDHKVLVSKLFDVTADSTVQESMCSDGDEIVVPLGVGIAGHTAQTGETVNIKNAYAVWFSSEVCARVCTYWILTWRNYVHAMYLISCSVPRPSLKKITFCCMREKTAEGGFLRNETVSDTLTQIRSAGFFVLRLKNIWRTQILSRVVHNNLSCFHFILFIPRTAWKQRYFFSFFQKVS